MISKKVLIRVVDDDLSVRKGLKFLLASSGYSSVLYEGAREFLEKDDPDVFGIIVLDIKMPEMDGIELHEELIKRKNQRPVVFLSGHGDIDIAVQAVKRGAYDFLQKPINPDRFLQIVKEAVNFDLKKGGFGLTKKEQLDLAQKLTEREAQIVRLLMQDVQNKEIAEYLNLSVRTVENHRAVAYRKLDVASLSQLQEKFALIKDELTRLARRG